MSASLLKILADFDTQLATAASVGGTSATIVTATDDDGNALPTGTYGLTIDGGNSAKEYIICTLTGTALTDVLSITRQGVTSSGFARAHRRGAKVTVTDWAILSRMLNNLDGTTGFNSLVKLGYDADPGLSTADANKFATVKYVDDTASAGAPDASTTTKGVTKLSATPVSPTDPIAVGDNDTRVPTQGENDALAGTSGTPSSTNKYVTQNDTTNGASQTAITIAFVNSNPDTITDSGNGFVNAGFQAGQTITVSGSTSNNNTFTIASVSAGTITLVAGDSLTAESAGATVTITAATIGKLIRTTSTGTVPPGTGIAGVADIQTFTANGTWTKPTGAKSIYVEVIGGGGSGAGGSCIGTGNFRQGGSGGGGGAFASRTFKASDLTGTVAVTVGASVTGGAGGTASGGGAADGTNGNVGNTSSFGAFLLAYGGGAGAKGTANSGNQTDKSGGAGGGTGGAGQIGQDNASSLGGSPAITAGVGGQGGSGAGGLITTATSAEYGGGSGGFGAESNPGAGGSSLYGGAGGGAGGGIIDSGTYGAAGAGGNVRTTTIGGGGAAGANGGSNGTNGTAGDSTKCGTGGGGGGANNAAGTAGNGGDGGAPGGGGGGGGAATNNGTAGTGGAGGRGEVRVTTYF